MWNDTDTPLAYFIFFRTYGTWFPFDDDPERGDQQPATEAVDETIDENLFLHVRIEIRRLRRLHRLANPKTAS